MAARHPNLDRQTQFFQGEIQQQIALQDDEIDRIAQELIRYKTRIAESKIHLQQLNRDLQTAECRVKGCNQCDRADLLARIAQRKAKHNQTIQQLESDHSAAVDCLQEEFTEEMERTRESHEERLNSQFEDIERQKAKVHEEMVRDCELANELAKKQQLSPEEDEDVDDHYNEMIVQLRNQIRKLNAERFERFQSAKTRLIECLAVLEEMDREQEHLMAERRRTLTQLDSRYQEELKRLGQSEREFRSERKEALKNARRDLARLQRALHKLQSGQRDEMRMASSKFAGIEQELASSAPVVVPDKLDSKELKKLESRRSTVRTSKQVRDQMEAKLSECRSVNASLRREVARMKHERTYGQRFQQICASGYPIGGRMA
jgi:chromosome segregation ATPase